MSTFIVDMLESDPHQPRLKPGWDGQGVRLVCTHSRCLEGGGAFLDIDLSEVCTIVEALMVAVRHVDQMHMHA